MPSECAETVRQMISYSPVLLESRKQLYSYFQLYGGRALNGESLAALALSRILMSFCIITIIDTCTN